MHVPFDSVKAQTAPGPMFSKRVDLPTHKQKNIFNICKVRLFESQKGKPKKGRDFSDIF